MPIKWSALGISKPSNPKLVASKKNSLVLKEESDSEVVSEEEREAIRMVKKMIKMEREKKLLEDLRFV